MYPNLLLKREPLGARSSVRTWDPPKWSSLWFPSTQRGTLKIRHLIGLVIFEGIFCGVAVNGD